MATVHLRLPNGRTVSRDFPDNITNEQIQRAFMPDYRAAGFNQAGPVINNNALSAFAAPPVANPIQALAGDQGSLTAAPPPSTEQNVEDWASRGLQTLGINRDFADRSAALLGYSPVAAATTGYDLGGDVAHGDYLSALKNGVMTALNAMPDGGATALHGAGGLLHSIIAPLWHGSPHKFEKFMAENIGTGEGSQAFGHGLYFAENPDVAKIYQGLGENLRANWQGPHRGVAQDLNAGLTFAQAQRARLQALSGKNQLASPQEIADEAARVKALKPDDFNYVKPSGSLYQVRLDANPEDFLDWDKPVGVDRLNKVFPQAGRPYWDSLAELSDKSGRGIPAPDAMSSVMNAGLDQKMTEAPLSGQSTYDTLAHNYMTQRNILGLNAEHSARQEAAQSLLKAGIPGIRYLDQGSRGAGNGTSNYVVFDPSIIDIMNRY